jgi:hypothetical protein
MSRRDGPAPGQDTAGRDNRLFSGRDTGLATAELAVVLPALLMVTVLCVWAVASVAVHVRCLDAARTGARALAREEPAAAVVAVIEERAPRGASVEIVDLGSGLVAVEVRARVGLPGPWSGDGPGVSVGGRAVAVAESAPDGQLPQGAPDPPGGGP